MMQHTTEGPNQSAWARPQHTRPPEDNDQATLLNAMAHDSPAPTSAPNREPIEDPDEPAYGTLPRLTRHNAHRVLLWTFSHSPTLCVLGATMSLFTLYICLDCAWTVLTVPCGMVGMAAAAFTVSGLAPLTIMFVMRIYLYRTALVATIAETAIRLQHHRFMITMNMPNFSCYALVSWCVACYLVFMASVEAPEDQLVCYQIYGHDVFPAGQSMMGDGFTTLTLLLITVPLTVILMMTIRDPKEDSAKRKAWFKACGIDDPCNPCL